MWARRRDEETGEVLVTLRECDARHARNLVGGMVAGALAGLFAGWVMNRIVEKVAEPAPANPESGGQHTNVGTEPESSSVLTARRIAERMGRELTDEEARKAGPVVHYAFSALTGAVYGALVEYMPFLSFGLGTLFGTAVWVAADEIALPKLELADDPKRYPAAAHARSWAAHAAWGAALEVGRRVVRVGSR